MWYEQAKQGEYTIKSERKKIRNGILYSYAQKINWNLCTLYSKAEINTQGYAQRSGKT